MRRKRDDPKSESSHKKVRFDEASTAKPEDESRVNKSASKLFQPLPRHAEFNRLRRLIYSRLNQEQVAELNRDLETYRISNDMLVNFFTEKGRGLLSTAMLINRNTRLLAFIFDKISPRNIQIVLQQDNYSLLLDFLTLARVLAENKLYTTSEKQLRIDKLIMLLRLSAVEEFISTNKDQLPTETQQEFNEAMKKITELHEYPSPKL